MKWMVNTFVRAVAVRRFGWSFSRGGKLVTPLWWLRGEVMSHWVKSGRSLICFSTACPLKVVLGDPPTVLLFVKSSVSRDSLMLLIAGSLKLVHGCVDLYFKYLFTVSS